MNYVTYMAYMTDATYISCPGYINTRFITR